MTHPKLAEEALPVVELIERCLVDLGDDESRLPDTALLQNENQSDHATAAVNAYQELQELGGLLAALEGRLSAAPQSVGKDDRYQILNPLDRGEFPTVFVALDTRLNREVVVKVPHPVRANRVGASVAHEGRALAGLPSYLGVVSIYDADEDGDFIVMEYLRGGSLQGVIDAAQGSDNEVVHKLRSLRQRIACLIAIADAVSFCHKYGVVHRDLKPANIVFRDNDATRPCLVDLGLAHFEDSEATTDRLIGTMPYLAPEQLESGTLETSPVADQFSLGVLAVQLLTGLKLRERPTETQLKQALENLAPDLRAVLRKAICEDPRERYDSVAEFRADLECYLAHEPISACTPRLGRRLTLFAKRRRVPLTLTALLLGLLLFSWSLIAMVERDDFNVGLASASLAESETPQGLELDSVRYARLMSRAQQFDRGFNGLVAQDVEPEVQEAVSAFVERTRIQYDERHAFADAVTGSVNDEEWAELFALQTAMFGEELAPNHQLTLRGKVNYPAVAHGRLELLVQHYAKAPYSSLDPEWLTGFTTWESEAISSWLPPGAYRLLHLTDSGELLRELDFRRLEIPKAEILLELDEPAIQWDVQSVLVAAHSWNLDQKAMVADAPLLGHKWACSYRLGPLVTWGEFDRYLESTGQTVAARPREQGPSLPAHVTWHEASAYAVWAGARLPSTRDIHQAIHSGVLSGVERDFLFPTSPHHEQHGEWVGESNVRDGASRYYFASNSVLESTPGSTDLRYMTESPRGQQSWCRTDDGRVLGIGFRLAKTESSYQELMRAQEVSTLK